MKLAAALVIVSACGVLAAPPAAAEPIPACDSAGCVPYVARNAALGDYCHAGQTHYVFGLGPGGQTMVCNSSNQWAAAPGPLIGTRNAKAPCGQSTGMAQSPDGQPMTCVAGGWTPDFDSVYY
jgi:hypothetical protein